MQLCGLVLCFLFYFLHFCIGQETFTDTEDCILYDGIVSAEEFPLKPMYRQLSTGIQPKGSQFAAKLSLESKHTDAACNVLIHSGTTAIMVVNCAHKSKKFEWSPVIFKEQDITEMWIHLGSLNGSKDSTSSDLTIIGRRGSQRNHFLFPSSGLRPPLLVHWQAFQPMNYYYNCVTGCVLSKSAVTSPGEHSIYLRPGKNFTELHISYNSTEHRTFHELTLNSSDITLDDNWKNVTVVWKKKEGDIGVLVDGNPIRELGKYVLLGKKNALTAEIRVGGGYLTLCDEKFRNVADARSAEDFLNESLSPAASPQNLSGESTINNWLVVLALVCICLLAGLATVLVILLLRTKKALQRERDVCVREVIPVDSFGVTHTATIRSTVPLYPSPDVSPPPPESARRVKAKAPDAPTVGVISTHNGP